MSELKNISQKKRVIVMILCITTLASLYNAGGISCIL